MKKFSRIIPNSKINYALCREYFRQLTRLTREAIQASPYLLLVLGLFAGVLDYAIFAACRSVGWSLLQSHVASLLGAEHISYFLLVSRPGQDHGHQSVGDYGKFLTIVLLTMFLRSGIIGFSWVSGGSHASVLAGVIMISGIITWLVAIVPVRLGVFRLRPANWQFLGWLCVCYVILLRLVYAGNIELIQEEAYYWNYSQHLAAGYLDHPPMVALLIRFGTLLFGNNEFGVRAGPFLCWFITAFYSYRLTQTAFGRAAALRAVILAAVLPIFFGVGLLSTPDAPLVACWAAALYYLYRGLVREETKAWYLAGIWLGLGLCSKYTIAFLGAAVLLYMIMNSSARRWFLRPQPYATAILALLVFSPVISWNYHHAWASFLFQSQDRLAAASEFSTHLLLLSALLLLTPIGLFSAVHSLAAPLTNKVAQGLANENASRKTHLFWLTMTLAPLSIFFFFSLTKEVKLNWIGPLWLGCLPLLAVNMENASGRAGKWVAGMWPATLVATVLLYGGLLQCFAFGVPGTSFSHSVLLSGWDDLARKVSTLIRETRHPALVVGMDSYRTASGLAFYRNKLRQEGKLAPDLAETTGPQLFGQNALMYDYWFSPEQAVAHDLIVVADRKDKLAAERFRNRYGQLGEIKEISVNKRGKVTGHYFYRVLSSYQLHDETPNTELTSLDASEHIGIAQHGS